MWYNVAYFCTHDAFLEPQVCYYNLSEHCSRVLNDMVEGQVHAASQAED